MSIAYFSAGCFGKLPTFGDFVRHNAASREARALDQWIQEGLYFAKTRLGYAWDEAFKKAPAYHFLFYSESAERFLVGLLQPSRDKGERKYPFLVFVQVDRPRFGEHVPLIPLIFTSFFEQAQSFIGHAANGLEAREIAGRVERLNVPVPTDWGVWERRLDEQLSAITLEELLLKLFANFADPKKYLLMKNLTESLLPFRQRNPANLKFGLRFPLTADSQSAGVETSFWLQASLRLLGNPAVTPIFFWNTTHLFLFWRQPVPRNLLQFIKVDEISDMICELDSEGQDKIAEAAGRLPATYRTLMEMPQLKLPEVLNALG